MNKESPFVREIENRLNVLFGEDKENTAHPKVSLSSAGQDHLKDISAGIEYGRLEIDIDATPPAVAATASDKETPRAREIEMQLDSRSEEGGAPEVSFAGIETVREAPRPADTLEEKEDRFEKIFGELTTSRPVLLSPIKDLKSIVLSLEWEIDAATLAKFDDETTRLISVFSDDQTAIGFLLTLRFLGRYIRVKGNDADPGSILLLMSIYDDLERIILSRNMKATERRAVLLENIDRYKEWVDKVDLNATAAKPEQEVLPLKPETEMQVQAGARDAEIAQSAILPKKKAVVRDAVQAPVMNESVTDADSTLAAIREMTQHEALAYALVEIKKAIREEFGAIRAELQTWNEDRRRA
ncbi:MAG: hypothetical protein ACE14T_03325 [Syntrophales bacterium]